MLAESANEKISSSSVSHRGCWPTLDALASNTGLNSNCARYTLQHICHNVKLHIFKAYVHVLHCLMTHTLVKVNQEIPRLIYLCETRLLTNPKVLRMKIVLLLPRFPGNGHRMVICCCFLSHLVLLCASLLHYAGKGCVLHETVLGWLGDVFVGCFGTNTYS